ncbi:threonine synthase [Parasphingopyxis marina]|uniref:threonine synthase n=1 Tax=Parasphingopyxis marina TaxID=2761622 RepID=UPI002E2CA9D0|nr:threonine synthase [Parasphingopyxis marina]
MTASHITHLECTTTGEKVEAGTLHNLSPAGSPLFARYNLDALKGRLTPDSFAGRDAGFWRYRELLPVRDAANIASLGEVFTPLVPLRGIGSGTVVVKDEGRLPTGSFKARGLGVAISMAKELGVTRIAIPTNGNAGAATAAYATRAGIESYVFCPDDTPQTNVRETALQGGKVWRVNGMIDDCGKIVHQGEEAMGWFNVATLREPYRVEGKKTMGFELAEQLGWELPDAIFYPTGGGTGLIGMWKAFDELEAVGLIGPKRPRMIAVQAAGCAPIVRAFAAGEDRAERWENASTAAAGIRVPAAIGDFLILRALRESGGFAIAVEEEEIFDARARIAGEEGLLLCPEGAAPVAAYLKALENGLIGKDERTIIFNCGNGLKYPMPDHSRTLDMHAPIDWESFA